MATREFNFDGIVGPTHNYSGLAFGNIASTKHSSKDSSPRQAALQGLEKMKFVYDLGVGQAVLPPLRRPRLDLLRALGFAGTAPQVIEQAWQSNRSLLAASFSASSMWTANAATVSPSADCADRRVNLTPANLISGLHRSIEATETTAVLRVIFNDSEHFVVHDPLPAATPLSDEGAANHTRLGGDYDQKSIEVFVYGRSALDQSKSQPAKFPARQTLEASQAVARRHGLDPEQVILLQQAPEAIDGGVFHNDVISVGNQNFLMMHEFAFVNMDESLQSIREAMQRIGQELHVQVFSNEQLPLADAVSSYLFNSQVVTRPDGGMTLICPQEASEVASSRRCTEAIVQADCPVDSIQFLDLRQSMNNGGGPACLRLRVVLNDAEQQRVHQGVLFNDSLYVQLKDWVNRNYREKIAANDLRDPKLIEEVDHAFVELAVILQLDPSVFRLGS